jgi:hypothetical protein
MVNGYAIEGPLAGRFVECKEERFLYPVKHWSGYVPVEELSAPNPIVVEYKLVIFASSDYPDNPIKLWVIKHAPSTFAALLRVMENCFNDKETITIK